MDHVCVNIFLHMDHGPPYLPHVHILIKDLT